MKQLLPLAFSIVSLAAASSAQCETQKLTGSDTVCGDGFGIAIARESDLMVVGAPYKDALGLEPAKGAAYLFERVEGQWVELQRLRPAVPIQGERLGLEVDVLGEEALVAGRGRVVAFEKGTSGWRETQQLIGADSDPLGYGHGMSRSGDRLVVGDIYHNAFRGRIFAFERRENGWVEVQDFTTEDVYPYDHVGGVLAMDGDTLVAGTAWEDDLGIVAGSAYVFEHDGDNWVQTQKLTASDAKQGDYFGFDVAIEGDTIAVGAIGWVPVPIQGDHDQGAVYIFERTGGVWTETQRLVTEPPYDATHSSLGSSVALDGDRLITGTTSRSAPGEPIDRVLVYERIGGVWSLATEVSQSDHGNGDFFGLETSLLDGDFAAVGDRYDDDAGADDAQCNGGAVYVYSLGEVECPELYATPPVMSLAAGGTQYLKIDRGAASAGDTYWVVGTTTGTTPGISLGGAVLPLNDDGLYFPLTVGSPNSGVLVDTFGVLDANGEAEARIVLPAGLPIETRSVLHHAFVQIDPENAIVHISAPVAWLLE